jgi:hypothetical protein
MHAGLLTLVYARLTEEERIEAAGRERIAGAAGATARRRAARAGRRRGRIGVVLAGIAARRRRRVAPTA